MIENPADKSDRGSCAYDPELASHGSLFHTSGFKRIAEAIGPLRHCTFAARIRLIVAYVCACRLVPHTHIHTYHTSQRA